MSPYEALVYLLGVALVTYLFLQAFTGMVVAGSRAANWYHRRQIHKWEEAQLPGVDITANPPYIAASETLEDTHGTQTLQDNGHREG